MSGKYILNTSGQEQTYLGTPIAAGASLLIQTVSLATFQKDEDLVRDLAADGIEPGLEALALLGELGADRPVFLRLEPLDLGFAVTDDTQRH